MLRIVAHPERTRPPVSIVLLVSGIAALWLGAAAVEIAARLLANAYARLGADLPDTTQALIATVRAFGHYVAAALGTLVQLVAARYRPGSFGALSATTLAVALVVLATSTIVLALPSAMCGEIWPDWPTGRAAPPQGGTAATVCDNGVR